MEELIDVLDENGVKTGQIVTRSEVHKKGLSMTAPTEKSISVREMREN